jgi:hypothetical protein
MTQASMSVSRADDRTTSFRPLSCAELDAVSGGSDPILAAKQAASRVKTEAKLAEMCDAGHWLACNVLDDLLTNGW